QIWQASELAFRPAVFDCDILAYRVTGFAEPVAKGGFVVRIPAGYVGVQIPDHRHRRLLRTCREGPRRRSAAECGQQLPPSDDDCHTPLPCEVRKGNDTTSRAYSLAVQGGRMLVASTLRQTFGLSVGLNQPTARTGRFIQLPQSQRRASPNG